MGVTFSKENYKSNTAPEDINNNTMFNFQMTAIGVKFGSNIGLFAEAGFGYKGLISGGFFAKF
jgi:hypothetical protein